MSEYRFINDLKEIGLEALAFWLGFALLVVYMIGGEAVCIAVATYHYVKDAMNKDNGDAN